MEADGFATLVGFARGEVALPGDVEGPVVLGVMRRSYDLDASDGELGRVGTAYPSGYGSRGLEERDQVSVGGVRDAWQGVGVRLFGKVTPYPRHVDRDLELPRREPVVLLDQVRVLTVPLAGPGCLDPDRDAAPR
jgi:hypothetical protein